MDCEMISLLFLLMMNENRTRKVGVRSQVTDVNCAQVRYAHPHTEHGRLTP